MNEPKNPDPGPASFFPMAQIRPKQQTALDYVAEQLINGVRDVVLSAPTGSGKSAIGAALCYWAASPAASLLAGKPGGYLLVTQKLLQDQLEHDIERFATRHDGVSLKSATEYECQVPRHATCAVGLKARVPCPAARSQPCECPYVQCRRAFDATALAITNYPFFLTERVHVQNLERRRVAVFDECHTVADQLIRFVDMTVSQTWMLDNKVELDLPVFKRLDDFVKWAEANYVPAVTELANGLSMIAASGADYALREALKLEQHVARAKKSLELIKRDPQNWVYWTEIDRFKRPEFIARPIDAAPFMPLLSDMGSLRVHMSAYPGGSKSSYCKNLGLNPATTAWLNIGSTFDPANRPVVVGSVGSMSRANVGATMPKFLAMVRKILCKHAAEKGIIHTASYRLGEEVFNALNREFPARILFPRNSQERTDLFELHCATDAPTVLLSPSMAEGFDFAGSLATWQILAKVPYPSLSDPQTVAKKDRDPDWYVGKAISSLIQASGRIIRSDADRGVTYILDSDFERVLVRYPDLFPRWYTEALVYPNR